MIELLKQKNFQPLAHFPGQTIWPHADDHTRKWNCEALIATYPVLPI